MCLIFGQKLLDFESMPPGSARPIQGSPLPAAQPLPLSGIPPRPLQFNNAPDTFEKFFLSKLNIIW